MNNLRGESLNTDVVPPLAFNRLYDDTCFAVEYDNENQKIYNRIMARDAVMRPDVTKCSAAGLPSSCSFYGPLAGKKVTQESFMQGRNQPLSLCPESEVIYLPEGLFAQSNATQPPQSCEQMPWATYSRLPRECFSLSEMDVYNLRVGAPGAWQKGWMGRKLMTVGFDEQTRMPALTPPLPVNRLSYGSYNSTARGKYQ